MTDRENSQPQHRNDQYPAKTDEPFTEQLFGQHGLRVVHFVIYSLVFVVLTILFDIIYATVRTLVLLILNITGLLETLWGATQPLGKANAEITSLFGQSLLNASVLGSAIFSAVLLTGLVFYWNEIRYKRGEWIRTFL